ncbi:hypothetical protein [Oceanibium sediminis]|uniref:hypothetical protein n=1 Tax=Oceanibium sediminis TaxID=2026339 RepID=UPI000DD43356|nr:hypothetical protein [Oceanibium sediminis]
MRARITDPRRLIINVIWAILALSMLYALWTARWSLAFVSLATMVLSVLPRLFVERFNIRLPLTFLTVITMFVFGTIFLGEAFDFYERYWWWDVVLHGGSAAGFGLIGFLFAFMLFEGDRYAAPPWAVAFIAFCIAVTIGACWEIYEFAMDQIFGLNMQKSGLIDTMWDLIVDCIGAFLGALMGYLYLVGRALGGITALIDTFMRLNKDLLKRRR